MSSSPSPARTRQLLTQAPAAYEYFATLQREWDLLCEQAKKGELNGIFLMPASVGVLTSSANSALSKQKQHQQQVQASRKHSDPSSTSLLGFQLFLLGGSDSDNDAADSNNNKKQEQKSSSNSATGAAAATALSPSTALTLAHQVRFHGHISVNSKSSPWYNGIFSFVITVHPGYQCHAACPTLEFTAPLSHPELRNGRELAAPAELFISSRRAQSPFMLREMIDAVRELFVQPIPLFKPEMVAAAALDVKYFSLTSSFCGLAAQFDNNVHAAELAFGGKSPSHDDERGGFHGAGAAAAVDEAAALDSSDPHSSSVSPAVRYQREEQHAARMERINNSSSKMSDDHRDGPRMRPESFVNSEMSVIFGEAHVPFILQRAEQVAEFAKLSKTTRVQQQPQEQDQQEQEQQPKTEEELMDLRVKAATKWIGRSAPKRNNANSLVVDEVDVPPSFDAWMTRRLTRVLFPQVANA